MIEFEQPWQEFKAAEQAEERGLVRRPGVHLGGLRVVAEVNHGRWVGMCPLCPNAMMLHPNHDFWCSYCGCVMVGGVGIRVGWPTADEMRLADDLLSVRPVPARNWCRIGPVAGRPGVWGERLVEDVAVENLERGLPIPDRIRSQVHDFIEADWTARGLAAEMKGWLPV